MQEIALILLGALAGAPTQDAQATIPSVFVAGQPFRVEVSYTAGDEDLDLEAWQLGPSAFVMDGKPLVPRKNQAKIPLGKGSTLSLTMDLSPHIEAEGEFKLSFGRGDGEIVQEVMAFQGAPEGLDFMTHPAEELGDFMVMLQTNRGNMLVEFYPDKAPNHVRNFLDLSYTGFYEGVQFHRVSPTFMIQGGCPNTKTNRRNTWGTGSGPRMLDAEFNDTKHERGILSMARGPSPNSGSCQFFVMTTEYPSLDNQYSVFGKLADGYDTLDKIANAEGQRNPRDGTVKPTSPQQIERTLVLKKPSK
jgi:cyclophilin family peptidyl-prolyl cis-trans isomerase